MSVRRSSVWMTLSGLKSQKSRLWRCRYSKAGRDAQDVGDGLGQRERPVRLGHVALPDLAERLAADVGHHDVARTLVLDEVVDMDDVRVLDLGQELTFGHGRGHGRLVLGVEQALEHHPEVALAVRRFRFCAR